MGYNTDFYGEFRIEPPLSLEAIEKLDKISDSRHEYIVAEGRFEDDVPGWYCQWVVNENGDKLQWDEGEKFNEYEEWLQYLCDKVINPAGSFLIGCVNWYGDERDDIGVIYADKDDKGKQKIELVSSKIVEGTMPYWYIG